MRLIQFSLPGKGKRVGLVQGDRVTDLTSANEGIRSTLDLLAQGKTSTGVAARVDWLSRRLRGKGLEWATLQHPPSRRAAHLLLPLDPAEVWTLEGVSALTTPDRRPELFFKATASRCAGAYAALGIRPGSRLTLPSAGVGVVLGATGQILGYTGYLGVSAVDLERESPRFSVQARVYPECCGLGPWLVTPDEMAGLHALEIRMAVTRGETLLFAGRAQPLGLETLPELAGWLGPSSPGLPGTVLAVEGQLDVPDAAALQDGDRVDVEIQRIGKLSHSIRQRGRIAPGITPASAE